MSRRSASIMGPPPPPPVQEREIIMGPPPLPHQGPMSQFQMQGQQKSREEADIIEKYRRLKRKYFELEEKFNQTQAELQRSGERNVVMRQERGVLLDRIIELEAQNSPQAPNAPAPSNPHLPNAHPPSSAFPRSLFSARAKAGFVNNLRQALHEVETEDPNVDPLMLSRHTGPIAARARQQAEMEEQERHKREREAQAKEAKEAEAAAAGAAKKQRRGRGPGKAATRGEQIINLSTGTGLGRRPDQPPQAPQPPPPNPPPTFGHHESSHPIQPQPLQESGSPPVLVSTGGTRYKLRPTNAPGEGSPPMPPPAGGHPAGNMHTFSLTPEGLQARAPHPRLNQHYMLREQERGRGTRYEHEPLSPSHQSHSQSPMELLPRPALGPGMDEDGLMRHSPPSPYIHHYAPRPPSPTLSHPPPSPSSTRPSKPKRLKVHTVSSKVFNIPVVPRDKKGRPILPLTVGINTVINLGEICTRHHFHNERYIYPIGYQVSRRYHSTIDPTAEVVYNCSILDGGDGPKFQIIPSDAPSRPIVSGTASGAWRTIMEQANAIRNRSHSNSVSGPEFYGLGQNTIKHLLQELPGADRLSDYVWQDFVEGGRPLGGRHAAVMPAQADEYDTPPGAYDHWQHYPLEYERERERRVMNYDGEDMQSPGALMAASPSSQAPPMTIRQEYAHPEAQMSMSRLSSRRHSSRSSVSNGNGNGNGANYGEDYPMHSPPHHPNGGGMNGGGRIHHSPSLHRDHSGYSVPPPPLAHPMHHHRSRSRSPMTRSQHSHSPYMSRDLSPTTPSGSYRGASPPPPPSVPSSFADILHGYPQRPKRSPISTAPERERGRPSTNGSVGLV